MKLDASFLDAFGLTRKTLNGLMSEAVANGGNYADVYLIPGSRYCEKGVVW